MACAIFFSSKIKNKKSRSEEKKREIIEDLDFVEEGSMVGGRGR